jgi:CIC family chloride channel protein
MFASGGQFKCSREDMKESDTTASTPSPQPNVATRGAVLVYPAKFWMLAAISGVAAGFAGGLLMRLLRQIEQFAYEYSKGDFLSGVVGAPPMRRLEMLTAAGLIAAAVGYLTPRLLESKPVGLNNAVWFRSGRLPFGPTLVHAFESIVIVGMGVSLGREGALKDTGAAIASKLSDWFDLPDDQRKLLVAGAAGAGMAAAYNIPFGGALFAVEVLMGSISISTVLPALAISMIATATSWLLLPNVPAYDVPAYAFHVPDLLWALLAAPIFGLASVVWVRAIGWAENFKLEGWRRVVAPVGVFAVIGAVAIWFPDVLGNGKGLVQRSYTDQLGLDTLSELLGLRLIATVACLGTGAPGGLFTPTMTFGAMLGGGLGRVWAFVVPGSDVGVFAAIGSAAVLAVATQGPISSIVMVMELTHHIDAIMVPLLIASVGASLVAYRFERRSIYTAAIPTAETP